jgi:hypothetical protein
MRQQITASDRCGCLKAEKVDYQRIAKLPGGGDVY